MRIRGLSPEAVLRLTLQSLFPRVRQPTHLLLCVADHYEPDWGGASETTRRERVERWVRDYPESVGGLHDSLGRPPQHTFFYPLEEYRPWLLDRLAELCHDGYGAVEVHLHHDNDTAEHLREQLEWFKRTLHERHGLLTRDARGELRYGFIHGNWALCNSRPDGRWCGVNDELRILRETGCYADFTLPAAPDPSQTRSINRIYYAFDVAGKPRSHDRGPAARVGRSSPDGGLLMIPGPLALDWSDRKYGCLPRLENADLHAHRPPHPNRVPLWESAQVTVAGRPDWNFVKLHTHGAKESNADQLLGPAMRSLHEYLARRAERDEGFRYYYVRASEMADLVHAAERGVEDPGIVLGGAAGPPRTSQGVSPQASMGTISRHSG